MTVELNERRQWQFVNGEWHRDGDGSFQYRGDLLDDDGQAFQGCRMAFCTDAAFGDFDAELVITQGAFTETGLIFAAKDPAHFFLLHFPDVGQASRARQFWVALSEMRGDGLLRLLKLECVRRVTPYPYGVARKVQIHVRGHDLHASINDAGIFRAQSLLPPQAGCVGLWSFRDPRYLRATVVGDPVEQFTWDPEPRLGKNWFHPFPADRPCWQMPWDLLRLSNGELLLNYTVQEKPNTVDLGVARQYLSRSRDGGRTWSEGQSVQFLPGVVSQLARLHRTPVGRLIAHILDSENGRYLVAESHDDARTWSPPIASTLPPSAPRVGKLLFGPQPMLNLANGSMLAFLNGAEPLNSSDLSVMSWGALHCRAFSSVSTDDGRTWSSAISVDGLQDDPARKPDDANLDLTEVSAVETGDGKILALVRPIYSPMLWETWSSDGGHTWEACAVGPFAGYALPNILRTANGTIVVAHRLPGLTFHCSRDDGRTWDRGTMVDSGLWCMGSMLEVEPNRVLYVYWDSFMQLMRAQFFDVTQSGLRPARQARYTV